MDKKTIIIYMFEWVIAIILVYLSIEIFLVYVFLNILYKLDKINHFNISLFRVNEYLNVTKLTAIMDKLEINENEVLKSKEKVEKINWWKNYIKLIEEDYRNIQN